MTTTLQLPTQLWQVLRAMPKKKATKPQVEIDPLVITPGCVYFNIRQRRHCQTVELCIENKSDCNYTLKVCCSNNRMYRVTPVLTLIEKRSSMQLEIARLGSDQVVHSDAIVLKYEYEPDSDPSIDHDMHRKLGTVFQPPRPSVRLLFFMFRKLPIRICEPYQQREKMMSAYMQLIGVFTLLVLKREKDNRSLIPHVLRTHITR